ncbi:MAG: hypothetical protein JWP74_2338 [Marmoricola sp.]|nr:hypothetical protein [Marmoricola sp.]
MLGRVVTAGRSRQLAHRGPLPGLVSGWIYTPTAGGVDINCNLGWNGAFQQRDALETYLPFTSHGYHTLSNNGEITQTTARPVTLECTGGTGAYTFTPEDPIVINLTPIRQFVTGSITNAP